MDVQVSTKKVAYIPDCFLCAPFRGVGTGPLIDLLFTSGLPVDDAFKCGLPCSRSRES